MTLLHDMTPKHPKTAPTFRTMNPTSNVIPMNSCVPVPSNTICVVIYSWPRMGHICRSSTELYMPYCVGHSQILCMNKSWIE